MYILRAFSDCELLVVFYASRDLIQQNPISCLIILNFNIFVHLQRLRWKTHTVLNKQLTLFMGVLLRMVGDFKLLCLFVQHNSLKSAGQNTGISMELGDGDRLSLQQNIMNEISKYITHKIELLNCYSNATVYMKQNSVLTLLKNKHI